MLYQEIIDVARIYETVLSIPGMNDNVKIALNIPRRNILLLSKGIEMGLFAEDVDDEPQPSNEGLLHSSSSSVTLK